MSVKEIKPNVYYVGSKDPQRKYFDQLVPLPDGTSYNSYLIVGSEKTALIDTVYPPREQEIIDKLNELNIKKLDYIIANHGEQDHTGAIPVLLEKYPDAMVVTNAKCKEIVSEFLTIPEEKFMIIENEDTLSLGDKTLEFMMAPWVHWPDTMFTCLKEDKILFTCDFLGSHLSGDNLYVEDEQEVLTAAKRYYAEIMMPFRKIFFKYIAKIEQMKPDMIASSHGPIYQKPSLILNAYKQWASDEVKNEVVVLRISMYGSTDKMVERTIKKLEAKGIKVHSHEALGADLGELAIDLVNAAGVIVAAPMVLSGPHPEIVSLVYLINALKPKLKYVSIMGSYSWGGMMVDVLTKMLNNLRGVDFIEPLMIKGSPKGEDLQKIDNLADAIAQKHEQLLGVSC